MNDEYTLVKKIIMDGVKRRLKSVATSKATNQAGDTYYSESKLKKIVETRKKRIKAAKTALKSLRTLGY